MKPYRTIIKVPLYGAKLVLSVSDDLWAARDRERTLLGQTPDDRDPGCAGLCSWWGLDFGLFFNRRTISHGAIAHEVFHLTHRILETVGGVFTPANHEPFTYLCQDLTDRIYRRLHKGRIHIPI